MTRADQQAKYICYRPGPADIHAIIQAVDSVDAAAMARVAKRIFATPPAISALGPLKNLESYEKIAVRLKA